jgi:Rieske Fe-S protein
MSESRPSLSAGPRRGFLKESLAIALGGLAWLVPVGSGLAVFLDPIWRKSGASNAIRVASLSALPADGVPRKFPVIANRVDAWNKYPDVPIGAVYLRRSGEKEITALNVACPHAGCFVDYSPGKNCFICPCHNSSFGVDGKIGDARSPSPRPLDTLEVEIRDGTEIWVRFQNFRAGEAAKTPVA